MVDPTDSPPRTYTVLRKGSFYNIVDPDGRRVFSKGKSASVVGPRWEELTETPWPYDSSAYTSGLRLWELGLIPREHIGQRKLLEHPQPEASPARPDPDPPRTVRKPRARRQAPVLVTPPLGLPAPRIDLETQARLMHSLHRDPGLLFDEQVQQALRHEVEYHRPQARWAQALLNLLVRYEKRQRAQLVRTSSYIITARHIAWQEQQLARR